VGGRAAVKLEVIPNYGEAGFRGIPREPLRRSSERSEALPPQLA